MNMRALIIIAIVATVIEPKLYCAEQWARLQSGNLTIVSDDEPRGKVVLKQVQEEKHALEELGVSFVPFAKPITIILTRQAKLLRDAWPGNAGSASTFGGLTYGYEDQIFVLADLSKWDSEQNIRHEFVHALFGQKHISLPLWLDEGLAENYSVFQVQNGRVSLGPLDARRRWKQDSCPSTLRFEQILTSSNKTVNYTSRGGGDFYHLSAVVVRSLIERHGIEAIDRFINAFADEKPTVALMEAFHETPEQIEVAALHQCKSPVVPTLHSHTSAVDEPQTISSLTEAELRYVYYGLVARIPGHQQEASAVFQEMLRLNNNDSRATSGMGVSLAFVGKYQEATPYLLRAADSPTVNATTLYYLLVSCSNSTDCPEDKVDSARLTLLKLRPDLKNVKDWRKSLTEQPEDGTDSGFLPDGS